jgi:hypothetical protein
MLQNKNIMVKQPHCIRQTTDENGRISLYHVLRKEFTSVYNTQNNLFNFFSYSACIAYGTQVVCILLFF